MDEQRDALSTQVLTAMMRIVQRATQETAAVLSRDGLQPEQFALLLVVRDAPEEPQGRLAARLGITGGALSVLATSLEGGGLLRRENEGAANRLALTARGQRLVDRLEPAQRAATVQRFADLRPAELTELHRLLSRALGGPPGADR